jgi:adenosylcobinamide kinase/adenosylcobinamide-phosphate guanylyltransferase
MIALVTGPVRAGKSDFARRLATERGGPVVFVAAARLDPADSEFAARIERHRRERPAAWVTVEAAGPPRIDLPALLGDAAAGTTYIVDSLGTWLADHLLDLEALAEREPFSAFEALQARTAALVPALERARADVFLVTEETGWGLVPPTPLGRVFRDALGALNRRVAGVASEAYLVVAGYALDLKAGRRVSGPEPE